MRFRCRLRTPTLPPLLALLLLAAAAASGDAAPPRALRVNVRPTVRECIPAGRDHPLATVHAKCPCLVRFRATNNLPSNTVLSFLVTSKSDYRAWKARNYVGTPRLQRRVSFNAVRLDKYVPALDKYGINTAPLDLNVTDDFVLLIRSSSQSPDCSLSVQYVFRPLPETCPVRLPPPPPEPPLDRDTLVRTAFALEKQTRAPRPSHVNASLARRATMRIVKGSPVHDTALSTFNVLLLAKNGRKCTGSLVSPRWVLTAAHCEISRGLALVGGSGTQDGEQITVVRAVPHPDFDRTRSRTESRLLNDLSLVKLAYRARAAPVTLNDNKYAPDPGTIVRASGYGLLFARWPSDVLHAVDLPVLGLDACRRRFRAAHRGAVANGIDDDAHLCVGRDQRCRGGICEGDSGGPLVARAPNGRLVQVGIASYGDAVCGNHKTPDVFTRVGTYADWIASVTNNEPDFIALNGTDRGVSQVKPHARSGGIQLSSVAKSVLVGMGAGLVVLCVALIVAIPVRARARTRRATSHAPSLPADPHEIFPPPPTWRPNSTDHHHTDARRSLPCLAAAYIGRPRRAHRSLDARRSLDPSLAGIYRSSKHARFTDR